jgi:hypothetical protein
MKFKAGSMNTVINKTAFVSWVLLTSSVLFEAPKIRAQVQLADVIPGDVVTSLKGTSLTRSSSSGGKSSLSFGANTTFGTSANLNTTTGSKGESISNIKFKSGVLTTTIGGEDKSVSADISNIRANDLTSYAQGEDTVTAASDTNSYSNGNADISGIFQSNELEINGEDSSFTTKLSSIHGDSAIYEEIKSENVSPDAQVASGSSGSMFSTTMDVDINTSDFVNSFQQAF